MNKKSLKLKLDVDYELIVSMISIKYLITIRLSLPEFLNAYPSIFMIQSD
jgi:hypothetical protein